VRNLSVALLWLTIVGALVYAALISAARSELYGYSGTFIAVFPATGAVAVLVARARYIFPPILSHIIVPMFWLMFVLLCIVVILPLVLVLAFAVLAWLVYILLADLKTNNKHQKDAGNETDSRTAAQSKPAKSGGLPPEEIKPFGPLLCPPPTPTTLSSYDPNTLFGGVSCVPDNPAEPVGGTDDQSQDEEPDERHQEGGEAW